MFDFSVMMVGDVGSVFIGSIRDYELKKGGIEGEGGGGHVNCEAKHWLKEEERRNRVFNRQQLQAGSLSF